MVTAMSGCQGAWQEVHQRIRVTLSSKSVNDLDKVCSDLIKAAKEKLIRVRGPVRMPTKVLTISTRKSSCGQGTNTWDRFEMRVHKRFVDVISSPDELKGLRSVVIPPGVDVEVTVSQ